MSSRENQWAFVRSGSTVLLPPGMGLAARERERLWKGLERFVNCADSIEDYHALSLSFPDFWPVGIWHYANQEPLIQEIPSLPLLGAPIVAVPEPELSDEELLRKIKHEGATEKLDWHPACHKLFLFYRDILRTLWSGAENNEHTCNDYMYVGGPEFFLGVSHTLQNQLEHARKHWDNPSTLPLHFPFCPLELSYACQAIVKDFRTAAVESPRRIELMWHRGDFLFVPGNDFQRAFYFLFRKSWRARVCPRCKMFFVARRPKQTFCGTVCSAGSRLASKRKWWNETGTRKRACQSKRAARRYGGKRRRS